MWVLEYKESWALKNWCFWTVVLEKTLENPLDYKEIQLVHPKADQSWVFIGRTMLKLKLQYFSHLMQKADSLEKTLRLGKIEARGEGDDRGQDGWMESLNQWMWVWLINTSPTHSSPSNALCKRMTSLSSGTCFYESTYSTIPVKYSIGLRS